MIGPETFMALLEPENFGLMLGFLLVAGVFIAFLSYQRNRGI